MSGQGDEGPGEALRRRRTARGVGLGDLARRAGVSKASLVDWEGGRYRPPGPALDRLLSELGVEARERAGLLARADPRDARIRLAHMPWGAPVDMGQVLRALRLRKGASQSDAARAAGVRQGTLAKWESGDAAPSDEALGRAFAILGATPEETAALDRAVRGERRESEDVEARIARIVHEQPVVLRDVLLLGMEADLWWEATRDPAGDALLCRVVAVRAQQSLIRGAPHEIGGRLRRAIRLARSSDEPDRATPAVYAANWVRQRVPGRAAEAAHSLGRWAARVRDPAYRDWLVASQGLALVRAGATDEGVGIIEGLVRAAGEATWESRHYQKDLVEAWLIAGRPERAREVLDAMDGGPCETTAAKVAAALGEEPSPAVMESLRAAPDWLGRHEADRIERLVAQVRRGRVARLD